MEGAALPVLAGELLATGTKSRARRIQKSFGNRLAVAEHLLPAVNGKYLPRCKYPVWYFRTA